MKKILITAIFALATALSFTGCYDAIFQSIRNEVELEEGTMPGFINNIARFSSGSKEYLLTSNGALFVKDASVSQHGAWNGLSGNGLPGEISYSYWDSEFSGVHFYKVAADTANVYALGYTFSYDDDNNRNIPDKLVLYTATLPTDGSCNLVWTLAEDVTAKMNEYMGKLSKDNYGMDLSVHLFCTNTYDKDNRKAYIRIGGGSPYVGSSVNDTWKVYELNGNNAVSALSNDELTRYTLSAVYYNSGVHFINYLNAITNEQTGHSEEYVYFGDSSDVLSSFKASDATSTDTFYKDADGGESVTVSAIQAYCCGYYTKDDSTSPETYSIVLPAELIKRVALGTGAPIISMCATKDSLLLGTGYNRSQGSSSGTGKGIFKVALDSDGKPGTSTVSFSTNADSAMCSPYYVRLLFCTDPSKTEIEADLYASVDFIYTQQSAGASISNRGLWAYFPGRVNWNRE